MSTPKISIIVPVYNTGRERLMRCIDSILAQTYTDFELIIIDDGSTDESGLVCDEYQQADNRVIVIHKENGGVASAKNRGIETANGLYLSFIDSDDYVSKQYLEILISANTDDYDMVISGVNYCSETDLSITSSLTLPCMSIEKSNYSKIIPQLLDCRALNYHVAKLYNSNIIKTNNIRFTDFRITGGDDTVFNFMVLSHSLKIKVVGKNTYFYVIYKNSVSHSFSSERWLRAKRLDDYLTSIVSDMQIMSKEMRQSLDMRIFFSALWSSQEIINSSNISIVKKINIVNSIKKDSRIQEALSRNALNCPKAVVTLLTRNFFIFYWKEKELSSKLRHHLIGRFIPRKLKSIIR